ncbi:MAG: hypothetical protein JXA91_04550 [Candidatus Thermoplasmatota archaeon]|nr:hypothetical protein [Candidatus Thermoplasmatota archaeon]
MKKDHLKPVLILCTPIVLSVLVSIFFDLKNISIIKIDFLIQFLGILLGFIFTILAFIYSMTESIKNQLVNNDNISDEAKTKQFELIDNLHDELKDGTKFVFILFCLSIFFCFLENINLPIITIGKTKTILLFVVKLSILFLSLYSIYDIMEIMFKISKVTAVFPKKKQGGGER